MNADTNTLGRVRSHIPVRTSALVALVLAPFAAMAQSPPTANIETSSLEVSFPDLDLSTPDGVSVARDRLHRAARRQCSQFAEGHDPSYPTSFLACMDTKVSAALRQIGQPERAALGASGTWHAQPTAQSASSIPETLIRVISVHSTELSTPEGVRSVQERVRKSARQICVRISDSQDLTQAAGFAKCMKDTVTAALRQVRAPAVAAIDETVAPLGSAH